LGERNHGHYNLYGYVNHQYNMNYISIIVSLIALAISALSFWLANIKKGNVKMTRPTIICFLGQNKGDEPKIFIRTLLYSTSDKGQYIQNMFIRLQQGRKVQDFNIWAYGDNGIVRGSGLFVNKNGISSYHHFLLPKVRARYSSMQGDCLLQFFAETVNEKPQKIFETHLTITEQQLLDLEQGKELHFDWAPNTQNYFSYTN